MRRPIKHGAIIKIGGHLISKYKAQGETVEVIFIVRAYEDFFAVVAHGRFAHRAFKLREGQVVEVQGRIINHPLLDTRGWKVVNSITCNGLREGKELQQVNDPFADSYEMSKFQIFRKCSELNIISQPCMNEN